MIYRNIAWYDKQVLQPLKRDPLTFLGRAIGAFAVAVGLVIACVYACAAIGSAGVAAWEAISYPVFWMYHTGIPAIKGAYFATDAFITGVMKTTVWPGVFDFSWGAGLKIAGIGKSVIDGNPLGALYSAFSPLGYFEIESFWLDTAAVTALGEIHEGWDIL